MKNLIIIGAGGHGRVIADIAQKLGVYDSISFLDDGEAVTSMGLPIVGKTKDIEKYVGNADFFVAIGNCAVRQRFIERLLTLGVNIPTMIHPQAVIGSCVEIGAGSAIMAGVVINPCAKLGTGVIVNTGGSVDHDCVIGDYAHISVGARVAGSVSIGEQTWLGVGAAIKNNVNICEKCMIGAGAVVVKDITEAGTYIGVPARIVK